MKKYRRTNMRSFTRNVISVTTMNNLYLIGHLTQADLSLLKDFDIVKEELDIVNKCYVTRGKGLNIKGYNVYLRDTMLLAPGGKKSLATIGNLYDDRFSKIKLTRDELENMDKLLIEDPKKFIDYALKDSEITLIHASFMEDFNFKLGYPNIPLTLSNLGSNYLKQS